MTGRARQSGIALITALLVVALASIASAAILSSANLAIHRTANLQISEVAWGYAAGVESWIKSILERDGEQSSYDGLDEAWAQPVPYLPIDEGAISGAIIDLQGRFNLNNLAVTNPDDFAKQQEIFVRMVTRADIADAYTAAALAAAIRDWTDADIEPTGFDGAEDGVYLALDPPYRTPNRLMASVSELRAIKGVTSELYDKLRPLVAALPQTGTPINVNTAPEAVLRALTQSPSASFGSFVKERVEKPVETVSAIYNDRQLLTAADAGDKLVAVSSSFFRLRSEVVVGTGRVALYSFFYRPRPGAPIVYGRSTDVE